MIPEIVTEIPWSSFARGCGKAASVRIPPVTFLDSDFPVFWSRAEGCNVWDADGNRYLDWTSAFGVVGLGHGHAAVREALVAQSGEADPGRHGRRASRACQSRTVRAPQRADIRTLGAGRGKVILGNSGFEAVEAALKTSVLYSGKPGVIAFTGLPRARLRRTGSGRHAVVSRAVSRAAPRLRARTLPWLRSVPVRRERRVSARRRRFSELLQHVSRKAGG